MKTFLKKLREYYVEHNYDVKIETEKIKNMLHITLTYKKVSTIFVYSITFLNLRLANFTYEEYMKFIEKIAVSILFDIVK